MAINTTPPPYREEPNLDVYLIAADGAHSRIRERLGIRMLGRGVFSNSVTIYFRGDVGPLLRGRSLSVIYVINPVLRGFFRIEIPFTEEYVPYREKKFLEKAKQESEEL